MDVEAFLKAYGIPYVTNHEHKHSRPQWINLSCPLCYGNPGYHLGYSKEHDYWVCWRCGYHSEWDVLFALLKDRGEVERVRKLYHSQKTRQGAHRGVKIEKLRNCTLPREKALTERARAYLEDRGYDPDTLIRDWGIFYGGNFGQLAFRIIIPITYKGKTISYTARDITGKQGCKYLTAPESVQTFNPKHTLFGIDYSDNATVLVVEGPFDAFRFGHGAVSTLGIKYTRQQLMLMAHRWKTIWVLYDADRKGQGADRTASQKQAISLVSALSTYGCHASRCSLTDIGVKDPGDLTKEQAQQFMTEIFTKGV